jgi:hypothetical protein
MVNNDVDSHLARSSSIVLWFLITSPACFDAILASELQMLLLTRN